jgi:hypothetical protein
VIVAIDPGRHGHGLSAYTLGRVLAHAEYVGGIGGQKHMYLETLPELEARFRVLAPIEDLIIEIPQVYDTAHQRGDQADLIDLAAVVGACMALARPYLSGGACVVRPAAWKGQLPKDVSERRIRSKLSADELARVELPSAGSLHHNVWDAIALGFWRAHKISGTFERAP